VIDTNTSNNRRWTGAILSGYGHMANDGADRKTCIQCSVVVCERDLAIEHL
jgi:hypothetical protein